MQNRIRELRQSKKITQVELAKYLSVSQGTLSFWEQGKYEPDNKSLTKIADYFGVSVDYLLGKTTKKAALDGDFEKYGLLPIKMRKFRVLGEIACGKPVYADEDRETLILADADIDADFCLYARGDSMTGARIMDGDIVFIKAQDMVDNGEIAAVIVGDEATLKRVYYYPDKHKLVLNAENPHYEPLVYTDEELSDIRILGKAVAFQSAVR